jgi:hypothetical protein
MSMRFGFEGRRAGNGRDVELTRDYHKEPEELKETTLRSENRAGMNWWFGLVILLALGWCGTSSAEQCIEYVELFRGTIDGASVYPREVVKLALEKGASSCLLFHNHPLC